MIYENVYAIEYPEKHSKAEVQAVLWYSLRKHKLDARLEVTAPSARSRHGQNKLNVVVYRDKKAICIIECKSWAESYIRNAKYRAKQNTKQIRKYKDTYGIPVLLCGHMSHVESITKIALSL